MNFGFHPLSNLFPLTEGSEFDELVASIKASGGPHEPIIPHAGMILDGRNRARACAASQIEPRYVTLADGVDPLQLAIERNIRRRHLNESQRALVAARIARLGQGARIDISPTGG